MKFVIEFDLDEDLDYTENLREFLKVVVPAIVNNLPTHGYLTHSLGEREFFIVMEGAEAGDLDKVQVRAVVVRGKFNNENLTKKQTGTRVVVEEYEVNQKHLQK